MHLWGVKQSFCYFLSLPDEILEHQRGVKIITPASKSLTYEFNGIFPLL